MVIQTTKQLKSYLLFSSLLQWDNALLMLCTVILHPRLDRRLGFRFSTTTHKIKCTNASQLVHHTWLIHVHFNDAFLEKHIDAHSACSTDWVSGKRRAGSSDTTKMRGHQHDASDGHGPVTLFPFLSFGCFECPREKIGGK